MRFGRAVRLERQRDRNHLRAGAEAAGDRRRAILQERADDLAGRRELDRREEARQHRVDVGARHRELGRARGCRADGRTRRRDRRRRA